MASDIFFRIPMNFINKIGKLLSVWQFCRLHSGITLIDIPRNSVSFQAKLRKS